MARRIFISYRRADTANQAGWLAERLAGHYGRPQVIFDVDSIQLGNDFADVIAAAVTSCDALLALIGHQWLTAGAGPNDFVRMEIESALTRGVRVIPVLVDGARMPAAAELPPGLAMLAQQPPLSLGAANPEGDVGRLIQALDQSIAVRSAPWQAIQAGQAQNQPTVTGMAPSWGAPAIYASPSEPRPAQPGPGHSGPVPTGPAHSGPVPTGQMRRRPKTWVIALVLGVAVAAAIVAFIAIPSGHPASSASSSSAPASASAATGSRHNASPKAGNSPGSSAAAKVLLADDFSTNKVGWVDDAHASAGAYTGSGAYRLSVTGYNGQNELARPSSAGSGLSGVTPLNLDASVDVRTLSGATQGYGLGLAFRGDGNGDLYAFLIEDHAVAIQKWVGTGARITGDPAPVSVSDLHVGSSGRLRAVATTIDGGQAVHLELWLNGKKLIDYTDRDNPYTRGYMGLYVESISDSTSTAAAEFDNFTAAKS
ncbi:MAG: toll/interleukin-1 receptor domain-containing protein [Streptosporangiaceae bacterium]